jgi:hypothetical protein
MPESPHFAMRMNMHRRKTGPDAAHPVPFFIAEQRLRNPPVPTYNLRARGDRHGHTVLEHQRSVFRNLQL